jgi:hypothetical protein
VSEARRTLDFRPSEWAIAVLVAGAVMAGAGFALRFAALDRPAAAPAIDRGIAVAVKVVPVLDLDAPLLKQGGKRDTLKLPDRWVKQTPKPRVEPRAIASTTATTKPPPPDAEITKQLDTPVDSTVDAGTPANVGQEGHADGVKEGTETDPRKARAVDLYRARISAWFSSRFRVSGSGLGPEEIVKPRVGALVQISADRTVVGYTLSPSGNAAFDAAARAMLDAARGEALPPPPENYPDIVQSQIHITLVCRPNICD